MNVATKVKTMLLRSFARIGKANAAYANRNRSCEAARRRRQIGAGTLTESNGLVRGGDDHV